MASSTVKLLILFAGFATCYADFPFPFASFEKKENPSLEASASYGHPVFGGAGASLDFSNGDSEKSQIPLFPPIGSPPSSPPGTPPDTPPSTPPGTSTAPTQTLPPQTATETATPVTVTATPVTQTLPPVTVTVTQTPPGTTPPTEPSPPTGCGCSSSSSLIQIGRVVEKSFLKCIVEAVEAVKDLKPTD